MRPIGCPETSVLNYHYSLRNDTEQRSSRLLCGGSLESHKVLPYSFISFALDGGDLVPKWSRGSVLTFGTQFAGSNPAEAVGFLRVNKNPQHVAGHGLSVVIVVCCQVEVSATN